VASRRQDRRRALDILYEADIAGLAPSAVLARRAEAGESLNPFTVELVTGVEGRLAEIDGLLGAAAADWTVARMPAVDRSAMRVACYELLTGDVSTAVAISEAVEAVGELSTEGSVAFVNGVLGRIARDREATGDEAGASEAGS
jgi:N utilization substance protein B